MQLVKSPKKTKIWAFKNKIEPGIVFGCLKNFMKYLRMRKAFVLSHEKKFEIANKILDSRKDKKCIVFSSTISDAEKFRGKAMLLHSKKKAKENKITIENFNALSSGVLSTSKAADAGVDIKGLSVGVIIAGDSSSIRTVQRINVIFLYKNLDIKK